MLDEGPVIGVCFHVTIVMRVAFENAGVDHRQRVKNRDVTARQLLECLGRGVDLRERSRCALDGADGGLDMRVLFSGGENGRGVVGERLFQGCIRGGGDDGIEISA